MSSFIELIETFEIQKLSGRKYVEKMDGLLNRFPKYELNRGYRIVLWQKYPKTADDYVSMKFCAIGRVPVYGIYNKRDLQLIAICVEGTLFAIDDCDLDPNLVPDLKFQRVILDIRHSPLAVRQALSYTETSMCSAISIFSLGYTLENKHEWTDAFVLLMGITTHAVRIYDMQYHIQKGVDKRGDAQHVPLPRISRLQHLWRKVSKAIISDEFPYFFKYYDNYGQRFIFGVVSKFNFGHPVQLLSNRDRWKGDKFWTRNDDRNGLREVSKRKVKYETSNGHTAAAVGAIQEVDNSKLTKSCGTTESIYHVIPDAFRRTLPVPALASRQKVDKINFVDLYGASESAYPRMPDVFRRALAAAALGAIEMVSTSIRDMCFDQFGISKENEDPEKAKQNQEHRQFVQLGCGTIKEVLGATHSYPLQGIMTRVEAQHSNANAAYSYMLPVFRRSLQHRVLKDVHKGLSRIHLK